LVITLSIDTDVSGEFTALISREQAVAELECFDLEYVNSKLFQNVGTYFAIYMASYPIGTQ
jgi:hypothetical protein